VSNFCDHCAGQRFDRARVIRVLRQLRKDCGRSRKANEALALALNAVRALDIPHFDFEDDEERHVVH
jgi:hypothetical protein